MTNLKVVLDINTVGAQRVFENVTRYFMKPETTALVIVQEGVGETYFREWAYVTPIAEAPKRPDPTRDTTGAADTPQPSAGTVRCPNKEEHDRHWYVVQAGGITYAQGYCEGYANR